MTPTSQKPKPRSEARGVLEGFVPVEIGSADTPDRSDRSGLLARLAAWRPRWNPEPRERDRTVIEPIDRHAELRIKVRDAAAMMRREWRLRMREKAAERRDQVLGRLQQETRQSLAELGVAEGGVRASIVADYFRCAAAIAGQPVAQLRGRRRPVQQPIEQLIEA